MDTYPNTHTQKPTRMQVALKLARTHTQKHTLGHTHFQLVNSPNRARSRSHGGYSLIRCGDCGEEQIKTCIRPNKQQDRLDLGIKEDTGMIRYVPLSFLTVHCTAVKKRKINVPACGQIEPITY